MSTLAAFETSLDLRPFSLDVEELEPLEAPFDWDGFWSGFRAGVAVVGVLGGGIAIGVAIT
jgi:hypothetical protein